MELSQSKLKQTLKDANSSVTKNRMLVFTFLQQQGPVDTGSMARSLGNQVDRATVYRTIELFEKLGIVNRIWHGFKNQVELSEIFTPHHHHASCQNCGQVVDITSSELEATIANIGKKHRFLTIGHSVELTGYCENCQN